MDGSTGDSSGFSTPSSGTSDGGSVHRLDCERILNNAEEVESVGLCSPDDGKMLSAPLFNEKNQRVIKIWGLQCAKDSEIGSGVSDTTFSIGA